MLRFLQSLAFRTTRLVFSALLFGLIFLPSLSLAIVPNGKEAPDFKVETYEGKEVHLDELKGKTVVLEWFNRGCPFVEKHYKKGHMQALQEKYSSDDIVWLTINSTNPSHKDFLDSKAAAEVIADWKITAPQMIADKEGSVGKLYGAKTTPHMFVINPEGKVVYQGAIDDNPSVFSDPGKARNYVGEALEALKKGAAIEVAETKPYGCSVKY